jgi:glycosyltransferase involved in cell wall biosynthesis
MRGPLLMVRMDALQLPLPASKLPYFSVVIPVFNRVEPLQRAVESVFAQTYQNFEIIIVDDGSELDVAKQINRLVQQLSDVKISLIRHDHNKNGAAARNTGIRAAQGLFLCFLDSDDYWLPNKLELLKECIQSFNDSECFLIHHQYRNCKNGLMSQALPSTAKLSDESVAHYSFITNNVGGIQSSTICVPTKLAKISNFDERFSGHQDWDFALKIGALTRNFVFIEKPLTIRGKDSQDSVAERLDWRYSLWFYSKMSKYFESDSAAYFFERVVLSKTNYYFEIFPFVFNKLFLKIILVRPRSTLKASWPFFSRLFQRKKRLRLLERNCKIAGIKRVMIWGANDYAKSVILYFNQRIHITHIIDSKTTFNNSQLLGINIASIRTITRNELNNVDALILATDTHQQSMKNDLAKIDPTLLNKVIEF